MLRAEPGPLDSVVRVEKNQIGFAHRVDELLAPSTALRPWSRNLRPVEQRVRQESACFKRLHSTRPRNGSFDNIRERVENLRSEVTELARTLQVVETLAAILVAALAIRQVPADSQPLSSHEGPKQGELSKVSDVPDVSILHGAPKTTTNQGRSSWLGPTNL
jgi:hypothetical protein